MDYAKYEYDYICERPFRIHGTVIIDGIKRNAVLTIEPQTLYINSSNLSKYEKCEITKSYKQPETPTISE